MEVRLLIDTNSIIALLNGNANVIAAVETADDIIISVINELEFKSFANLSLNDIKLFDEFITKIKVLDISANDTPLKNKIIEIRNRYKLKLPDSIIAACAIVNNAALVTGDQEFKKVNELQLILVP